MTTMLRAAPAHCRLARADCPLPNGLVVELSVDVIEGTQVDGHLRGVRLGETSDLISVEMHVHTAPLLIHSAWGLGGLVQRPAQHERRRRGESPWVPAIHQLPRGDRRKRHYHSVSPLHLPGCHGLFNDAAADPATSFVPNRLVSQRRSTPEDRGKYTFACVRLCPITSTTRSWTIPDPHPNTWQPPAPALTSYPMKPIHHADTRCQFGEGPGRGALMQGSNRCQRSDFVRVNATVHALHRSRQNRGAERRSRPRHPI